MEPVDGARLSRRTVAICAVALAGVLAGCRTAPAPAPAPPPPAPKPRQPVPLARSPLAAEQRRLAALFLGTPVVFVLQADGSLRADVPLRYCFDPGASAVKPPLAAVLDRLAKSQRDEPSKFSVTAPIDPGTSSLMLGTERAGSARDYMVARGIAAARFTIGAAASGARVQILVTPIPGA